jgi:hypothetical protein
VKKIFKTKIKIANQDKVVIVGCIIITVSVYPLEIPLTRVGGLGSQLTGIIPPCVMVFQCLFSYFRRVVCLFC